MPTYVVVPNDPSTFPEYAYNEVIIGTDVYITTLLNPPHNVDIDILLSGYNRMLITTEYIDMMSRKDATFYHGSLAPINYVPAGTKYEKYGKPDMGLIESPVGRSLTSKPRTGGNKLSGIPKGYFYTKKKGVSCAPGFKHIGNKCVKQ